METNFDPFSGGLHCVATPGYHLATRWVASEHQIVAGLSYGVTLLTLHAPNALTLHIPRYCSSRKNRLPAGLLMISELVPLAVTTPVLAAHPDGTVRLPFCCNVQFPVFCQ